MLMYLNGLSLTASCYHLKMIRFVSSKNPFDLVLRTLDMEYVHFSNYIKVEVKIDLFELMGGFCRLVLQLVLALPFGLKIQRLPG